MHGATRRPRQSPRYSARYLVLAYSKTPERFDASEIQRLVSKEQGKCAIVRQIQVDDTLSYLTFVDFSGKRFQTRNLGLFDVQGQHPKWSQIRSSPRDVLASMIANGEVVWNGLSRDAWKKTSEQDEQQCSRSKDVSPMQWEYLGSASNEEYISALYNNYMTAHEPPSTTTQLVRPRNTSGRPAMNRDVSSWREGYQAGYNDALARHEHRQVSGASSQSSSISPSLSLEANLYTEHPKNNFQDLELHAPAGRWSLSNFEPLDWDSADLPVADFSF